MEQKTKQSTCVTSSNLKRDLNSRGSPPSGHLGSDSLATSKAVIHYRARSNPFSLPHAKQKTARWAVFVLFGCGGSGARRNDRTVVNKVPFGTLEPYGDRARRREGFEPHVLAFSLRRKCCGQFGGSDLPPAGHSLPPHPPSYSPFGLITLSLRVHTLSQAKQKTARWLFLLCLVIKGRTNLREHEQKLLKILHFYGMTHGFLNLKKEKLP